MKILRLCTLLFSLSFLLDGCSYSTSDIYLVEPLAGQPTLIQVTTNLDTLIDPVVFDSLLVIYECQIDQGELYYVESGMENYWMYDLTPDYDPDTLTEPFVVVDSFWLQASLPVDAGSHTLIISFYYSSNTNSLGDVLGVEADILDLEYSIRMEGGTQ